MNKLSNKFYLEEPNNHVIDMSLLSQISKHLCTFEKSTSAQSHHSETFKTTLVAQVHWI